MWISVRFMFFRVFSTLPTNVPVDEPLFCGNRRKPWRSWRSQKKRLNTPRFRVLQMGGVMFFCPDSHGCVTSVQFGAGNHLHGDDVPVLVVLVTRRARRRSVTSHCHPPAAVYCFWTNSPYHAICHCLLAINTHFGRKQADLRQSPSERFLMARFGMLSLDAQRCCHLQLYPY